MPASGTMTERKAFRQTLGRFPTGVAVATAIDRQGRPAGLTISSFNSVSLDPPLILWSLAEDSDNFDCFSHSSHFAINILAADQADICGRFSSEMADRFEGIDWHGGAGGAPVLANMLAVLECRSWARYAGGDHIILVGEVLAHQHDSKRSPLVYAGGQLTGLAAAG